MINKIIDGISIAIDSEFNVDKDIYTIYDEEVNQGLETPCFFINSLNPSEDLFRGNRYKEINQFSIQFIPNDTDNEKKHTCNDIRERLFFCLEYITITEDNGKSLIRGNKMYGEYVDGTLNFFVNYDLFVNKQKPIVDKMESYDYSSEVMEG